MNEARNVLIPATVTEISDGPFLYAACKQCYSKLIDQSLTFSCKRCGIKLPWNKVEYRYRLTMTITDSSAHIMVTVFGGMLNSFFGCTATDLRNKWMKNLHGLVGCMEQEIIKWAIEETLMGCHMHFGFRINHCGPKNVKGNGISLFDIKNHCGDMLNNFGKENLVAVQVIVQNDQHRPALVIDHLQNLASFVESIDDKDSNLNLVHFLVKRFMKKDRAEERQKSSEPTDFHISHHISELSLMDLTSVVLSCNDSDSSYENRQSGTFCDDQKLFFVSPSQSKMNLKKKCERPLVNYATETFLFSPDAANNLQCRFNSEGSDINNIQGGLINDKDQESLDLLFDISNCDSEDSKSLKNGNVYSTFESMFHKVDSSDNVNEKPVHFSSNLSTMYSHDSNPNDIISFSASCSKKFENMRHVRSRPYGTFKDDENYGSDSCPRNMHVRYTQRNNQFIMKKDLKTQREETYLCDKNSGDLHTSKERHGKINKRDIHTSSKTSHFSSQGDFNTSQSLSDMPEADDLDRFLAVVSENDSLEPKKIGSPYIPKIDVTDMPESEDLDLFLAIVNENDILEPKKNSCPYIPKIDITDMPESEDLDLFLAVVNENDSLEPKISSSPYIPNIDMKGCNNNGSHSNSSTCSHSNTNSCRSSSRSDGSFSCCSCGRSSLPKSCLPSSSESQAEKLSSILDFRSRCINRESLHNEADPSNLIRVHCENVSTRETLEKYCVQTGSDSEKFSQSEDINAVSSFTKAQSQSLFDDSCDMFSSSGSMHPDILTNFGEISLVEKNDIPANTSFMPYVIKKNDNIISIDSNICSTEMQFHDDVLNNLPAGYFHDSSFDLFSPSKSHSKMWEDECTNKLDSNSFDLFSSEEES